MKCEDAFAASLECGSREYATVQGLKGLKWTVICYFQGRIFNPTNLLNHVAPSIELVFLPKIIKLDEVLTKTILQSFCDTVYKQDQDRQTLLYNLCSYSIMNARNVIRFRSVRTISTIVGGHYSKF